jgi:lysophospholipase L1-like esterase
MAGSLAPGFERAAAAEDFVLWNASVPGCGLADVGEYWIGIWQPENPACKPTWRERWPEHIDDFDPDVVVVLVGGHDTTDRLIDGVVKRFDAPEGAALTRSDIQRATRILSARGARVVWLTLPYAKQGWAHQVDHDRSAFNDAWVDRWNETVRAAVAELPDQATVLDLNALACPGGTWTDAVNGVSIREPDLIHFNDAGAELVAQWAVPQLFTNLRPAKTEPAAASAPG